MKKVYVIKLKNIYIRKLVFVANGEEYILAVQFGKTLADVL